MGQDRHGRELTLAALFRLEGGRLGDILGFGRRVRPRYGYLERIDGGRVWFSFTGGGALFAPVDLVTFQGRAET